MINEENADREMYVNILEIKCKVWGWSRWDGKLHRANDLCVVFVRFHCLINWVIIPKTFVSIVIMLEY